MKFFFDFLLAIITIAIFAVPIILIAIAVRITSKETILYWSIRVGRNNKTFNMPKFRSMQSSTPSIASNLLEDPSSYLTPIGSFLRKSSLDELPQLLSVLKGDMSFVGPRPALYNQKDLIALRKEKGINKLLPGITGLAQINGRDTLSIPEKIAFEEMYLKHKSLFLDIKIILTTLVKIFKREDITH